MRGKPAGASASLAGLRIIPAHAGQTAPAYIRTPSCADHPRACGANSASDWVEAWRTGSSPRMRGKQRVPVRLQRFRRIIPAHAGQTRAGCVWRRPGPDHPRACGANAMRPKPVGPKLGSSPRMRGKRLELAGSERVRRIIPAHAGQTRLRMTRHSSAPDHPRACGANCVGTLEYRCQTGSSPRMRGKLIISRGHGHALRIIPAHAGQTCSGKSPRT